MILLAGKISFANNWQDLVKQLEMRSHKQGAIFEASQPILRVKQQTILKGMLEGTPEGVSTLGAPQTVSGARALM